MFITESRELYTFGANNYGQLGIEGPEACSIPTKVTFPEVPRKVACGHLHTMVLTEKGSLYTWGFNIQGQLGDGTDTEGSTPKLIIQGDVTDIAAGGHHSWALKKGNILLGWGGNGSGQQGQVSPAGINSTIMVPTELHIENIEKTIYFGCGYSHTFAMNQKGQLYLWGNGEDGQLGNNSYVRNATPHLLEGFTFKKPFVSNSICT